MRSLFTILFATALLAATVDGAGNSAPSGSSAESAEQSSEFAKKIREIPFQTIDGDTITLADFAGKVVLIVNVASLCGNTPQYADLQKLYENYKDSGLVIIGFPANNFGGQEPGSNEEILDFCQTNFHVTFPMMAKVSVKGKDKHPLFVELTEKSSMPGEINWNFSKFLLDRKGDLVARFDPKVKPLSDEIVAGIQKSL